MVPTESKSKPTEWTCNACGQTGTTSREHLIHVAIGRVILRNKGFSPSGVREQLRSGHFREFGFYEPAPTEEARTGPGWIDQTIRGLICETCNGGWAKTLEEQAGANLYDFIHLRGPADATLLRRWTWFFAVKLWFAHTRTEFLADAPGRSLLEKLARSDFSVAMPVRLVRLPFSDRTWDFAANMRGWAGAPGSPYIMWVIRGVVFLVIGSETPKFQLPIPTSIELTDGLRLHQVPMLRRGEVHPLFSAPPATPGKSAS